MLPFGEVQQVRYEQVPGLRGGSELIRQGWLMLRSRFGRLAWHPHQRLSTETALVVEPGYEMLMRLAVFCRGLTTTARLGGDFELIVGVTPSSMTPMEPHERFW